MRRLKDVLGPAAEDIPVPVLPKVEIPPISETREDVLRILKDDHRTPEDKAIDIRKLVQDLTIKDKTFLDEKEQFVVCQHTLALLDGEQARDRRTFQDNWCAVMVGKMVCK